MEYEDNVVDFNEVVPNVDCSRHDLLIGKYREYDE